MAKGSGLAGKRGLTEDGAALILGTFQRQEECNNLSSFPVETEVTEQRSTTSLWWPQENGKFFALVRTARYTQLANIHKHRPQADPPTAHDLPPPGLLRQIVSPGEPDTE
jgi:hypothetical protein